MAYISYEVNAPEATRDFLNIDYFPPLFFGLAHLAVQATAQQGGYEEFTLHPDKLVVTPFRMGKTVAFILDSSVYQGRHQEDAQIRQHVVQVEPPERTPGVQPVFIETDTEQTLLELTQEQAGMMYSLQDMYKFDVPEVAGIAQL